MISKLILIISFTLHFVCHRPQPFGSLSEHFERAFVSIYSFSSHFWSLVSVKTISRLFCYASSIQHINFKHKMRCQQQVDRDPNRVESNSMKRKLKKIKSKRRKQYLLILPWASAAFIEVTIIRIPRNILIPASILDHFWVYLLFCWNRLRFAEMTDKMETFN